MSGLFAFDGASLAPLDSPDRRPLRAGAWLPDGSACLLAGNRGAAFLFDGQRFAQLPTGTDQNLRGAAWSADGTTALLVGNRGTIVRVRDESVETLPAPTSENLRRVAWHPDGSYALAVGNAGIALRIEESGVFPLPGDRAHTLRSVAFRPDGAYALVGAYASRWAGYPKPHALYRCDGRHLQSLLATDDDDDFVALDWRPGAQEALAAGYAWRQDERKVNKVVVYDGSGFRFWKKSSSQLILGAGWHPSGEYALISGGGGLLLRFDGRKISRLDTSTRANLIGPLWRPDGEQALFLIGPEERVYTV
jgi:WD40 repeat protein